ncbi:MAG: hypothetical protein WCI43_01470 [Candidatus Firestonebacteria bacterium]
MKKNDISNYFGFVEMLKKQLKYPFSFLNKGKKSIEAWRKEAKERVFDLMAFRPKDVPFRARVHGKAELDGVVIEDVSYDLSYGPKVKAYFLYPKYRTGKLPAIFVLHDHGGYKYFGKEKVTEFPGEYPLLKDFRNEYYGGRAYANELAKRGFAVLVIDLFMWGSRKFDPEYITDALMPELKGKKRGSEEYIKKYNRNCANHEGQVTKHLLNAGTTLQGVFSYEDRRGVDYLLTRKEIDPGRIGCVGLSGGGLRTVYLAGLDERIKCAVCVGFMSTYSEFLNNKTSCHTWMLNLPHLSRFLDFPDLVSLRVPAPLMVQYDIHDGLYTIKGQRDADKRLQSIYAKAGKKENYKGIFYPGPHKFDLPMQEDAFDWFEKWLQ